MFCIKCGSNLREGASFCTNCGAQLDSASEKAAEALTPDFGEPAAVTEQPAAETPSPIWQGEATATALAETPESQSSPASEIAPLPKKKKPVLLFIIGGAVLVIALVVAICLIFFRGSITKTFMGDENYARYVVGSSIEDVIRKVPAAEKISSTMLAATSQSVDDFASEYDYDFSEYEYGDENLVWLDMLGAILKENLKGSGFSVEESFSLDIKDEERFGDLFNISNPSQLKVSEDAKDYSYKVGFAYNDSSYQYSTDILNKGNSEFGVRVYYDSNGKMYIMFPQADNQSILIEMPEHRAAKLLKQNSEEIKLSEVLIKELQSVLKKAEASTENDTKEVGKTGFSGNIVSVTLNGEDLAKIVEAVADEIPEDAMEVLADRIYGSSSELSREISNFCSELERLEDDITIKIVNYVKPNGEIVGASLILNLDLGKDQVTKASLDFIRDNNQASAVFSIDKTKYATLEIEGENKSEGTATLTVKINDEKSSLKIKYSDLGETTLFGEKVPTGKFSISASLGNDMEELLFNEINSDIASALLNSVINISSMNENGGYAFGLGVDVKGVCSVSTKSIIREEKNLSSAPSGQAIELSSDNEEELAELADTLKDKLGELGDPIVGTSMSNYIIASRVTSANSTAASIKNNIDAYLTKCDTEGCGMYSNATALIKISIDNGVWKTTLNNTSSFKSGRKSWGENGTSEKDRSSDNAMDGLALELKNLFPDIKTGAAVLSLIGGKACYLAYTDAKTVIEPGKDCPNFSPNGAWQNYGSFPWNGVQAGVTKEGIVVGTAPASQMDEYAVPYDEPGMNGEIVDIEMPDLRGYSYDEAVRMYGGKLAINKKSVKSKEYEGTIISQDISAGRTVKMGTVVEVEVSDGTAVEGKVLNIYAWNEEFKGFFEKYYNVPYGITVNWIINPSIDDVYRKKLNEALSEQGYAYDDDDKIDLFLVEPDYMKEYVDSDYSLDLSTIGIYPVDTMYQYTIDAGTDSRNGQFKAVSFQCCPSVLIYRRSIAKQVLGTDDPDEVQKKLSSWNSFNNVAAKAKDMGYFMTASYYDTLRSFTDNRNAPWVDDDNELNIDEKIYDWINQSYTFVQKGYTLPVGQWDYEKNDQMYYDGKTMCFFGPAWYYNYCMGNAWDYYDGCYGDWAVCEGPAPSFWGGTCLVAANGTDNPETIADIMRAFTMDEDVCYSLIENEKQFTNNSSVNRRYADNYYYGNSFLGGQNDYSVMCNVAEKCRCLNTSVYDYVLNYKLADAFLPYFKGEISLNTALWDFYSMVEEKFPSIYIP